MTEMVAPGTLERITATGDRALPIEARLEMVAALRSQGAESSSQLDRYLLGQLDVRGSALLDAGSRLAEVRALHEKLTASPWIEAIFLHLFPATRRGRGEPGLNGDAAAPRRRRAAVHPPGAVVMHGGARRAVAIADGVDPALLRAGDTVYLAEHLNVILAHAGRPGTGEMVAFERRIAPDRVVVKHRDEELIVDAGALADMTLRPGDRLLWSQGGLVAYDKIERSSESQFLLEELPRESFDRIGGLSDQIRAIQDPIRLQIEHPDVVARLRIPRIGSILLVGPPGTGKTLLARCTANWLGSLSTSRRASFLSVKPGALMSHWYGQSEANVRELFQVARTASARDPDVPVVIFFDEIDAIGTARSHAMHRADRGVLLALSAELNGFDGRGNILVIAATNRREDLDAALDRPERIRDVVVEVPRPDRSAAHEILSKYLEEDLPYGNDDGAGSADARAALLDAAVSRIYAPNGAGQLATLVFRDGKTRGVTPQDLVSGAVLANVARRAKQRAGRRGAYSGEVRLRLDDVLTEIAAELETSAAVLTRHNCRLFLSGLPADVDVVDVRRAGGRVRAPHRFLAVE